MARQVLRLAHELREREGLAVIHITHFMSEVVDFDRLVVLEAGEILMQGTPHEIFAQADELEAIGLGVPAVTRFARRLYAHGIKLPQTVLTAEELAAQLGARINGVAAIPESDPLPEAPTGTPLIETRGLHYSYMAGTPLEQQALRGVDCTVYAGETLAILGGTQAGKSTLIEFFNGLRLPAPGAVFYKGEDIVAPGFDLDRLREEIGIVFQQPEAQLFEDIVGMDVSYVPRRKGLPPAESRALVEQSLAAVGLDYETFRLRYVYALSGGQKRRVALAGVLAAQPQVLILDEPVAGLDPRGRAELSALIGSLAKQRKLTVVLVGNVIDELAELADRAIVLHEGRAVMQGSLRKLLRRADELYALGLELSDAAQIALALRSIIPGLPTDVLTLDELEAALLPHLAHTTPMYALDPTTDANKH
jgi:energy-coupling factor transport system ATP-binding protein